VPTPRQRSTTRRRACGCGSTACRSNASRVCICHLGDDGAGWAHTPPADGTYAIDPLLGRIALPGDAPDPAEVQLTWHEGFSADIGGGEYERGADLPVVPAGRALVRVPDDQPSISAALTEIAGDGVVEITDNGRYEEALDIQVVADGAVEIRASNGRRPTLVLSGLSIAGAVDSACLLNGLLVAGAPLQVLAGASNALARLELSHCTLVPGISLDSPASPCNRTRPAWCWRFRGWPCRSTAACSAPSVPMSTRRWRPATA